MPLITTASRAIHCKLIYWGPSASGKTANVRCLQQRAVPDQPHALRSWPDQAGQTAFFDQISLAFGVLHGFQTHLHVFATPGAARYAHTRAALLNNVDGVVFVADSRAQAQTANQQSLHELQARLQSRDRMDVPIVMQYNHRDAPDALAVAALNEQFGQPWATVEASAVNGVGVLATLKAISDSIFAKL
jgi:signal recognition particle receptor subunit beta